MHVGIFRMGGGGKERIMVARSEPKMPKLKDGNDGDDVRKRERMMTKKGIQAAAAAK